MLSTLKVQKNTRNSIPLLRSNTFHAPCLWGCVGLGLEWLADVVDFVSLGDLDETLQCLLDVLHTLVLGLIIRRKSKKIMSWRLLVYYIVSFDPTCDKTALLTPPTRTWWTGCTWRRQGPRSRSSLLSRMEGGSQSTHHHWKWWRFLEGWGSDTESDKERGRYQAGTAGSHKGRIAWSWIWEDGCHLCEPEDYCSPSVRSAA